MALPRPGPSGPRRRHRPRSHVPVAPLSRAPRALPGAFSLVFALALAALLAAPAHADPAPPAAAADPAAQLAQAQQLAVSLTEQWHAAKDGMTSKLADVERARAAVEPARLAAADARAGEERFRVGSDAVIMSVFENGRLDQLNALLLSDSPQHFLDQMTVLETLTSDQRVVLDQLLAVVRATNAAEQNAADSIRRAEQAAADAARAAEDIDKRKREAEAQIAEAEKLLGRLSPAERAGRLGPEVAGPDGPIAGNGLGPAAMRAAATRMNRPYLWGAEGPGSFDCSGLVYWAFKQVGVTMPRSSAAQAGVGRAVSPNNLQVGDLVFFYQPISHVGFYAGNGKILNAVQTGDVVRYSDMGAMPYTTARRL